jgi:hypothetical protein
MGSKGLLPFPQDSAIRAYEKPDEPSIYPSTLIFKIHFNITFLCKLRCSKSYFPFMPFKRNTVCISRLSHAYYILHPSHNLSFYHRNNVFWGEQITKFYAIFSTQLYLYLLWVQTFFQSPYFQSYSFLKVENQVTLQYKILCKTVVLILLLQCISKRIKLLCCVNFFSPLQPFSVIVHILL